MRSIANESAPERVAGAPLASPERRSRERASARPSKPRLWTGRVLSALPVAFLLFSGGIKLLRLQPVHDSFAQLGYPAGLEELAIGTLELACLAVYVVPRTSVLGAILCTGYLGGAVATHVRAGSPLATHVLFPLYVGALLWAGLFLREERLGALLPLRRARQ